MAKGYLSIQLKSQWLYLAFLLTLLAILAYDWIPPRTLTILGPNSQTSLYMDSGGTGDGKAGNGSGTSVGLWLDKSKHTFLCTFDNSPASYKFCGFNILQGDGQSNGLDFSLYHTLRFKVDYHGNAELLRFYMRHFSHELSDIKDSRNTSKYARILIPANDLAAEVAVPLSQFSLADWWVRAVNLSTEQAYPEFTNIINIGIDHPYPVKSGDHKLQVHYIKLEGVWLTKESWYLSIVGFWFAILVLKNLQQLYRYRSLLQENTAQLGHALSKAEHLEQESNHYRELSHIDQLTGTLNRRGIQREVETLVEKNLWPETTIILMDIDLFKPVNDTYGHDVGDKVLEALGKILRDIADTNSCVGRWGGEEFIVITPNTSAKQAFDMAEIIRQKIAHEIFCGDLKLKITASFGVGQASVDDAFETTFRHADRALYLAKKSGRNCVKISGAE